MPSLQTRARLGLAMVVAGLCLWPGPNPVCPKPKTVFIVYARHNLAELTSLDAQDVGLKEVSVSVLIQYKDELGKIPARSLNDVLGRWTLESFAAQCPIWLDGISEEQPLL